MKKILPILCAAALSHTVAFAQGQPHIIRCGAQKMHEALIAKDPSWAQRLKDQRASLQAAADFYMQYQSRGVGEKTTSVSAIPIIFHILVDSAQFNSLDRKSVV